MVIKQVCDLWSDKTVLQNNLHTKKNLVVVQNNFS